MNCLDYRRLLLAGEGETDTMRVHRLQCAGCAAEWQEHAAFEEALRAGLEVPVPAELAERIARAPSAPRRRFLAAAAGVVVVAGAGGLYLFMRQDALALACIDFVMKEEAKSIMLGPMPREEARAVLASTLPLERIESLGEVKHVRPCPFNEQTAYHVVLMVPQGKVTLLVMPSTRLSGSRHAAKEGMHADVVALRRGSVGVIGADETLVKSVASALRA